jgi:protein-S-isoprenylcysteine O-methyltransferase Ste14
MFKKILLYLIIIYSLGNYSNFFYWYLGDNQMIIEEAFVLSLHSSLPMFLAIFLIHIFYYPKINKDHASVISFPPIIFLFFTNLGFFSSTLNLYFLQLYSVPEFLNILRSNEVGLLLIIFSLIIFIISINVFNKVNENPIPTSSTTQIISKSIYKYTRNPMYLAMLILQVGIGMFLSMIHIIFFVIFTYIALKYYVILPEEKYLEKKFGTQYLIYKKTVRRWL